ncbi:hypothetical protein IF2G_00788 [Cordyceps javanica]|nr:hypothetical protein IF2G_00788 [Cordyceps javanica]
MDIIEISSDSDSDCVVESPSVQKKKPQPAEAARKEAAEVGLAERRERQKARLNARRQRYRASQKARFEATVATTPAIIEGQEPRAVTNEAASDATVSSPDLPFPMAVSRDGAGAAASLDRADDQSQTKTITPIIITGSPLVEDTALAIPPPARTKGQPGLNTLIPLVVVPALSGETSLVAAAPPGCPHEQPQTRTAAAVTTQLPSSGGTALVIQIPVCAEQRRNAPDAVPSAARPPSSGRGSLTATRPGPVTARLTSHLEQPSCESLNETRALAAGSNLERRIEPPASRVSDPVGKITVQNVSGAPRVRKSTIARRLRRSLGGGVLNHEIMRVAFSKADQLDSSLPHATCTERRQCISPDRILTWSLIAPATSHGLIAPGGTLAARHRVPLLYVESAGCKTGRAGGPAGVPDTPMLN